jgi:hypothetical protein
MHQTSQIASRPSAPVEERGALEQVAILAKQWFARYLRQNRSILLRRDV